MNRIIKNYILTASYELIALVVPLFTAPYLTRVLHAENFGIYSYIQSVGGLIMTLSLLGIYSYGNRQVAYCRDDSRILSQTFWEIMALRIILGAVGTIVYFGYGFNTRYGVYFTLYYGYFLANILDCSWIYVGLENMLPCVVKNTIAKLITLVGVFIFVQSEGDVWKYILLVSGGTLIVNISVYSQLRGIIQSPKVDIENLAKHLKGSAHLFLPQIASLLYLQMDKVMLEWLTGGTSQVSYYDQAEKIITIPVAIITALSTVMMPRIANDYIKGDQNQIQIHLGKAAQYSLLLAFPLAVGIASIATKMIPWYLGTEYMPTAYAMIIISPIVVSNTLLGITGKQYFTATNQIGILTISNSVAAVLNMLANWIMIPHYGYIGAAVATLVASYVNVLIQLLVMNKTVRVGMVLKASYKYLISAVIMGALINLCTDFFSFNAVPLTTIVQIVIGCIAYFGALLIIGDHTICDLLRLLRKSR